MSSARIHRSATWPSGPTLSLCSILISSSRCADCPAGESLRGTNKHEHDGTSVVSCMQAECAEHVEACKSAKAAAAVAQRDAGQAAARQQRARTTSAAMHAVVRALQDNVRSTSHIVGPQRTRECSAEAASAWPPSISAVYAT